MQKELQRAESIPILNLSLKKQVLVPVYFTLMAALVIVAATLAMDEAIKMAKENGVAIVGVEICLTVVRFPILLIKHARQI